MVRHQIEQSVPAFGDSTRIDDRSNVWIHFGPVQINRILEPIVPEGPLVAWQIFRVVWAM